MSGTADESANTLTTSADPYDGSRPRVSMQGSQGTLDITASITGGKLGGLLDFRTQVLDPARNDLGRLAAGLAESMNAQHRAGAEAARAEALPPAPRPVRARGRELEHLLRLVHLTRIHHLHDAGRGRQPDRELHEVPAAAEAGLVQPGCRDA